MASQLGERAVYAVHKLLLQYLNGERDIIERERDDALPLPVILEFYAGERNATITTKTSCEAYRDGEVEFVSPEARLPALTQGVRIGQRCDVPVSVRIICVDGSSIAKQYGDLRADRYAAAVVRCLDKWQHVLTADGTIGYVMALGYAQGNVLNPETSDVVGNGVVVKLKVRVQESALGEGDPLGDGKSAGLTPAFRT